MSDKKQSSLFPAFAAAGTGLNLQGLAWLRNQSFQGLGANSGLANVPREFGYRIVSVACLAANVERIIAGPHSQGASSTASAVKPLFPILSSSPTLVPPPAQPSFASASRDASVSPSHSSQLFSTTAPSPSSLPSDTPPPPPSPPHSAQSSSTASVSPSPSRVDSHKKSPPQKAQSLRSSALSAGFFALHDDRALMHDAALASPRSPLSPRSPRAPPSPSGLGEGMVAASDGSDEEGEVDDSDAMELEVESSSSESADSDSEAKTEEEAEDDDTVAQSQTQEADDAERASKGTETKTIETGRRRGRFESENKSGSERARKKRKKHKSSRKERHKEKKKRKEKDKKKKKSDIEKIIAHERDHWKTIKRTSNVQWLTKGAPAPAQPYFIDTTGDVNNAVFESLYRMDVPRYRRAGRNQVLLGSDLAPVLVSKLLINKAPGLPDEVRSSFQSRYFSEKALLREYDKNLRVVHVRAHKARRANQDLEEFIPLKVPQKPKPAESSDAQQQQQQQQQAQDEGESWAEYVHRRTGELNRDTRESPHDVSAWLRLLEFQDEAGQHRRRHTASSLEKKLAILDKALMYNPRSEVLLLAYMRTGQEHWDPEQALAEWAKTVSRHTHCLALWQEYIQFARAQFSSFSVEGIRELYAKAIKAMSTRREALSGNIAEGASPEDVMATRRSIEADQLQLFAELCAFEQETGHAERAVAAFQALVEFNCFRPPQLSTSANLISFFQAFWQSDRPRVGQEHAPTWRGWFENMAKHAAARARAGAAGAQPPALEESEEEDELGHADGETDSETEEVTFASGEDIVRWVTRERRKAAHRWKPLSRPPKPKTRRRAQGVAQDESDWIEDPDDLERVVLWEDVCDWLFEISDVSLQVELALRFVELLAPHPAVAGRYRVQSTNCSPPEAERISYETLGGLQGTAYLTDHYSLVPQVVQAARAPFAPHNRRRADDEHNEAQLAESHAALFFQPAPQMLAPARLAFTDRLLTALTAAYPAAFQLKCASVAFAIVRQECAASRASSSSSSSSASSSTSSCSSAAPVSTSSSSSAGQPALTSTARTGDTLTPKPAASHPKPLAAATTLVKTLLSNDREDLRLWHLYTLLLQNSKEREATAKKTLAWVFTLNATARLDATLIFWAFADWELRRDVAIGQARGRALHVLCLVVEETFTPLANTTPAQTRLVRARKQYQTLLAHVQIAWAELASSSSASSPSSSSSPPRPPSPPTHPLIRPSDSFLPISVGACLLVCYAWFEYLAAGSAAGCGVLSHWLANDESSVASALLVSCLDSFQTMQTYDP